VITAREIIDLAATNHNSLQGAPCAVAPSPTKATSPCTRVAFRLISSLVITLLLYACGNTGSGPKGLSNTYHSVEDIGKKVLEAVCHNDATILKSMSITEEEYHTYIWPQLPISKIKEWQEHYDFVWGQHDSKSRYSLRQMLARYGGSKYALVRVHFAGETTDYTTYKVHRDARLIVQSDDGKEVMLNLFGSIVEMNGQYKIMSFNTD